MGGGHELGNQVGVTLNYTLYWGEVGKGRGTSRKSVARWL